MNDLRLKVRNKIYTAGNHIINTKNNNNAIIVFIGEMSSEKLKEYTDNFLGDMLKSQIQRDRISIVQIDEKEIDELSEKIKQAVEEIKFNQNVINKLYISFVTVMDDDIYKEERKIDISAIEKLKTNTLGGYSVEIFYDFYGIFSSLAKYSNRANARKMIINFLDKGNGGINIGKRIYHQACPGDDYYRCAKSVTFMILVNVTEKINTNTLVQSNAEDDCYTWTTFALFEKNLVSLVIYEMINKLLDNQLNGPESVSEQTIIRKIKDILEEQEAKMKKLASVNDRNYILVIVRKTERKLKASEKVKNVFSREKISSVELKKENDEQALKDLLKQQKEIMGRYTEENITEEFIDSVITELIRQCTFMGSVNNNRNNALIYKCLCSVKNEVSMNENQNDWYVREYNEILSNAEAEILDKIIKYFEENMDGYMEKVQNCWNEMNMEVSDMINDFAAFQAHFNGIGDLVGTKNINLLCNYDDILERIDVQNVISAINANPGIYSNVLNSYYDSILVAGDIAQKFGNRNIVPNSGDTAYCLFSATGVTCPRDLKSVVDADWFREQEIAILFTAKNKMSDCENLPFSE